MTKRIRKATAAKLAAAHANSNKLIGDALAAGALQVPVVVTTPVVEAPVVAPAPAVVAEPKVTKKGQLHEMLKGAALTLDDIATSLNIGRVAAGALIGDLRRAKVDVKAMKVIGERKVAYHV